MLHQGSERQFGCGVCFVSGQSPGRRGKREVVILLRRRMPFSGGNVERQNKLALLAGVVQERRCGHVRCGLLRGLGGRRNSDPRRAIGQRHQVLLPDDLFNLLQPVLIKRQDRVAHQLLLFQFTNDVAIVARWQLALLGDLGSDRLHLGLNLVEAFVRQRGHLRRRDVDPI